MKTVNIRILLLALFGWLTFGAQAQINFENTTRLNDGWLFLRSDIGNIWEAVRPAADGTPETVPIWSQVSLPHCFNSIDAVAPFENYYEGPGWYKHLLSIDNPYNGGRTLLHFEGAGQKTDVYIYMTKVGSHVGGYDEWTVDITQAVEDFMASEDAARFKGKIPLSIRCDNSRDAQMIPSDLSDFNVYGGLYRYMNLVYTPRDAFSSIHIDVKVDAKGRKGIVNITAGMVSEYDFVAEVKIYAPNGKLIATQKHMGAGDGSSDEMPWQLELLDGYEISKPTLWSPSHPNLYTCELTLTTANGTMTCRERFGFRHFEFVEHGPFMLNGERLLLRGTHRHEDHAGVGAAMTEEMIVREMEMMKDMGVNFIRLGHYQQSRIVLQACDRLGILVWEEIPWCRGGLGGEVYQQQAKRMLTNMIAQHRNHPSVILWGIGNENDWPNDFPDFDKQAIRAFMKELNDLAHSLDDTRKTCIRRCDFCKDIVDVYSPSIWAGWYRGIYTDYKRASYSGMQSVKHFLHVEWGGDSHAQRHAEDPYIGIDKVMPGDADERAGDASLYGGTVRVSRDGDWSESYICDLIDWHLKEQETMEWLTGAAYWPFKDFSTPLRPENPVPYVNQKGVVERDFTPKEAFYVFQSYWTDKPMIRIYGHSWPIRWGTEGETKSIKVYSNCERAELFVDGISCGVRERNSQDFPAAGLRWDITPTKGMNSIKAVGYKGKERVEDEISFEYETRKWGAESSFVVTTEDAGEGCVWINAQLTDNGAVPCLDSHKYITFESSGDGTLIKDQGTSTGSSYLQAYNGRAKIKLAKNGGQSVVAIKADGIETTFITVK